MEEYRTVCSHYTPYIQTLELPKIPKIPQLKEAVLVEFRVLPHLEFIVRNAIHKLGEGWSHTIVCGIENHACFQFCNSIPNVRIIKTKYHNLTQNYYSEFLCTKEFWDFFYGEKILIYQEDSCIFKHNVNDFLKFDYIGAPYSNVKSTKYVGNGGLSLRTKKCMLDVIKAQPLNTFTIPEFTRPYCTEMGLRYCPEDVYFSINLQELNLGVVADWETAFMFSTESIQNHDATCGHKFWKGNDWKKMMRAMIRQVKIPITIYHSHCGGWNDVLQGLIQNQVVSDNATLHLLDMVERYFGWKQDCLIHYPWVGIIHYTPETAPYLNYSIDDLFKNECFIQSLSHCKAIICLSEYVKKYLDTKLSIPVHVIHHPINPLVKKFDYAKYSSNPNKYLLQVGSHLRRVSSIYKVQAPFHKKLWLTGVPSQSYTTDLLYKDVQENKVLVNKSVAIKYVEPTIYNEMLHENIVFIDLYDSSANNVILECIVRHTPILLNRTQGAVEYLGAAYPLFYNSLDEVPELLTPVQLLKAIKYLETLSPNTIKNFCKQVLSIIYSIEI